jgi:antitoxin (DNA-binding transcriptional repressor) of toxin-antitoxin stability system
MVERLRGFCWSLVLLALVIGVPWLVSVSRALEPPTRWPSAQEMWSTILAGRVSHDAAIGALAVLVVVAWLRFVIGALVAVWCIARGRPVRRLWVLGGATQLCAIGIVTGAALLISPMTTSASPGMGSRGADGISAPRNERNERNVSERVEVSKPAITKSQMRGQAKQAGEVSADESACSVVEFGDGQRIPVGLAAGMLLTGGVLLRLGVLRRRRLRSGDVPAQLATRERELEHRMRSDDPVDRLIRLDLALRLAAERLTTASGHETPVVVLAVIDNDGSLHLSLSPPCPALPPFTGDHEGRWVLSCDVALTSLSEEAAHAGRVDCPIVHVGRSDAGDLFIDLSAIHHLMIDGPEDEARGIVDTLVAGVVASPFGRPSTVIGIGFDVGGMSGIASAGTTVVNAHDADEAVDIAAVRPGGTVIVVGDGDAVADLAPHLGRELMAISIGTPHAGEWCLSKRAHRWVLDPLGLAVRPHRLGDDDLSDLARLLTSVETSVDRTVPVPSEPSVVNPRPVDVAPAPAPMFVEPPWTFVVRVLGPVGVECRNGSVVHFDKAKSCELIAWLALHRERQSRNGARTAMWDLDVQDATFANVVSEARRTLARAVATGEEWLGRTLGDTLPLHPGVVTDADLLDARLRHARGQSLTDAVETLRAGLEWVRGMPFSDAVYRWPDADGTTSRLVILATTAAVEMATLCLTVDDLEGVFWATGRGVMALPGHEELVGLRMRGYARRGDLAGVRHEWDTYLRALRSDGWGDDQPAPKLVALREDLLAPSPEARDRRAPTRVGVV